MTTPLQGLLDTLTIADGGWSTILRERGFDPQKPAELCNLESPDLVTQLALDYLAAGARILTTNTFSATRFGFTRWKRADWQAASQAGAEIARRAVDAEIARRAVHARNENRAEDAAHAVPLAVAGSIGPSGKIVAVREVPEADIADSFAAAAETLAAAGVDLLVLETFTELAEMKLALRAVRERCSLPVVACMSFGYGPQRTQTHMGAEAAQCASALQEAGADALGCNCGPGPEHTLPAVVAMRANCTVPLWTKPSVGLPELRNGRPVYEQSPEEFAGHMQLLVRAGAQIIGGCCGAGPEHIRRLALLGQGVARSPEHPSSPRGRPQSRG